MSCGGNAHHHQYAGKKLPFPWTCFSRQTRQTRSRHGNGVKFTTYLKIMVRCGMQGMWWERPLREEGVFKWSIIISPPPNAVGLMCACVKSSWKSSQGKETQGKRADGAIDPPLYWTLCTTVFDTESAQGKQRRICILVMYTVRVSYFMSASYMKYL